MPTWKDSDLHKHMHVYSSDNKELGHISDVYEDSFLVQKGLIIHKDRYIPYNAIGSIENNTVHILMTADEANEMEWGVRPDYEAHLADPTQLMYDRGHDVHDPFDETNPDKA